MKLFAFILSGCIGFLSLSQEILWVRLVSFTYHSVPQAFALVLALFLLGIASGAELGKRVCERQNDLVSASSWLLVISAIVDASIPVVYGWASGTWADLLVMGLLIWGSALCKSTMFPIMHHMGSVGSGSRLGVSVSTVYFSNIVGSTMGPLFTGFILLDHIGLEQAFTLIGAGDLMLAAIGFAVSRHFAGTGLATTAAALLAFFTGHSAMLLPGIIGKGLIRIIENRHGIIHVIDGGKDGDIIYGGNVYDGRFNTSLKLNSNSVDRVYILAALHPRPKRILVVGLSGGAWTKIISRFQGVERIDVVEINPGYIELIRSYPEVADILNDPRIHISIDDGRRWLKRHPGERYDLIVMNTTLHWRSYSSNLLAKGFLEMIRSHMNAGGILAYNSTGSIDAFRTASEVFPHAYMYSNFIIAGDHDFRGLQRGFTSFPETQKTALRQYEVITEQNMITEYKYGRGLFPK